MQDAGRMGMAPSSPGGVCAAALWLPLLAIALTLLSYLLAQAGIATSFWTLSHWLHMEGLEQDDSWSVMSQAFNRIRLPDAPPLYDLLLIEGVKFQYPPSSLLLYSALEVLGLPATPSLLNLVSWIAVPITALAVAALALRFEPYLGRRGLPRHERLLLATGLLLLTLLFYPVLRAYSLGQVQTWINAAFALACLAWAHGRRCWSGVLIGLVCLLKPQFVLLAAWSLLRGHRDFLKGWLAVFLAGTMLSLLHFGWQNHMDYLRVLSFISRHGESFFANQSANGLLHRLLLNGNSLRWEPHAFAPYHPVVHLLTVANSALLLLFVFAWRPGKGPSSDLMDFVTVALGITIASPVAWEHHYGIMPPLFAILLLSNLQDRPPSSRRSTSLLLLGLAFLLCGSYFPQANRLADTPLNFLQSYLFLGALLTLRLCHEQRRLARSAEEGDAWPPHGPSQDAALPLGSPLSRSSDISTTEQRPTLQGSTPRH